MECCLWPGRKLRDLRHLWHGCKPGCTRGCQGAQGEQGAAAYHGCAHPQAAEGFALQWQRGQPRRSAGHRRGGLERCGGVSLAEGMGARAAQGGQSYIMLLGVAEASAVMSLSFIATGACRWRLSATRPRTCTNEVHLRSGRGPNS